jgi:hypothetical protein
VGGEGKGEWVGVESLDLVERCIQLAQGREIEGVECLLPVEGQKRKFVGASEMNGHRSIITELKQQVEMKLSAK